MRDDDLTRYHRAAERCRSLAAKTTGPIEKDRLLRMGESWLKLARAPAINRDKPPIEGPSQRMRWGMRISP